MPYPGNFDADLRPIAWFDPNSIIVGWHDFAMPYDHPLMDFGTSPPPPPPGTWVFISNWG